MTKQGKAMFELDEKFFEEIGLNRMPVNEQEEFKKHIQEEIEVRVGERISDGMSPEKLDEFEAIIDENSDFIQNWVLMNTPDYKNDEIYQTFVNQNNGQESAEIMNEYAAMKWLQVNRPDFAQIIETVMNEMKGELRANINKIIG
ncbi:MAG: DUF5663 domain-containing protein [bacterium]|nr:DUF5663 domain-containing protein [bacterium]